MDYIYLPEKYHKQHKRCVDLISQIEEFIVNQEYACLKIYSVNLETVDLDFFENGGHPFDYLEKNGQTDELQKVVKHQVLYALLIDFCYFMQEALLCSKKMRLVVAYSLLRRPLVDDLKIILRLLYDNDFAVNFINTEKYDPTYMKDDDLIKLLNATDNIRVAKTIKGADIYRFIFDKNNPNSILNISNKAIHPITNRNDVNLTGKMNFNFMFANVDNIDGLWNQLYAYLIPIMMFYSELLNICVWQHNKSLSDDLFAKRYEQLTTILTQ